MRCLGCGGEVHDTRENYEMFEQRHWLCFHLMFEHHTNPDTPCDSRLCPIWHLEILKKHVSDKGEDPAEIINNAVETKWSQGAET